MEHEDGDGLEGVWPKSPGPLKVGRGVRKASDLWQQPRELSGRPARCVLPQNTCGDTQELVRIPIQPRSVEYNFMSRLTLGG
jgi:hypothetical protein